MRDETPSYIKLNSVFAALLLVPFFAALSANALDKLIHNHTLFNSWLWRMPALGIWVLRLPELALLLAVVTYVVYVARSGGSQSGSRLRRAMDVKHAWPVLAPAIIALGVLSIVAFHDSIQCWVHSPTQIVGHFSRDWRCSNADAALSRHLFL